MIKPGQLVRIGGGNHIGLVIKPAPNVEGFSDVDYWDILIGEDMIPCLESSLEVISDAR